MASSLKNPTKELSHLAADWMRMLEDWCPDDWRKMLPSLDLQNPDHILEPKALPVLSYLPLLKVLAPEANLPFVTRLDNLKTSLHFNQTYTADDFGADFLQQYGWIKFLGPDGYWFSDSMSSGFVLLGDNTTYPEHWHKAEELYFPISGTGEWFHENHGWQTKSPGDMIVHTSNVKHAMRTIGEPLLLLYIWRGGDLLQKSEKNDPEIVGKKD